MSVGIEAGADAEVLERAGVALGRLDGLALLLPEPKRTAALFVRKEAVLSAQVDGATASLSDLLLDEIEPDGASGLRPVADHAAALAEGVARLRGGCTLSAALLRDLHAMLRPAEVEPAEPSPDLAHVERILRGGGPVLPRAATAVAEIERRRPFPDGNGAMARMIVPLLLYGEGVLRLPLLYPSLFFRAHRDAYRRRVQAGADPEGWLDFFAEAMVTAADHAVVAARSMLALFATDAETIGTLGPLARDASRAHDAFVRHPRARVERIAAVAGLDRARAEEVVTALERLRVVRETAPGLFAYTAWIELLDEGTVVRAAPPRRR